MLMGDEYPLNRLAQAVCIGAEMKRVGQQELGIDKHQAVGRFNNVG